MSGPQAGRDPGEAMRAAQEMVRRAAADLDALVADVARLRAAEGDERARAAREGELGEDWRRVQRRIDQGTTTLAAVFDGSDESPEAHALRGRASAGLDEAGETADDADAPLADLRAGVGGTPHGGGGPLDEILRRWGAVAPRPES